MSYKIAINGYGRIGRCVLRAFYESTNYADLRIVAINDLADIGNLAHLTRYDSTHGRFLGEVEQGDGELLVSGDAIRVSQQADVTALAWADLGIDLVMECSGAFTDRSTAQKHISNGAKRVLFSQPADSDFICFENAVQLRAARRLLRRVIENSIVQEFAGRPVDLPQICYVDSLMCFLQSGLVTET